jgi:prepilin-type N-terminal cleavage/methylation domain-containing protein
MTVKRAFTLIELLVVIAIIAILAAILFPVFAQAKEAAKRTACLSNCHQIGLAVRIYMDQFDQTIPIQNAFPCDINRCSGAIPGQSSWPLGLQPYITSKRIFRCPSDPNATDEGLAKDPRNDQPLPPGTPDYEIKFAWATRTNYGMNGQFMCPMIVGAWYTPYDGPAPIKESQAASTSQTLFAVETVWDRTARVGRMQGGGHWCVDAPCVYDLQGNLTTPFPQGTVNWYWFGGWTPNNPYGAQVFGNAWPWHDFKNRGADTWRRRNEGTVSSMFMDSHTKAMRVDQLSAGCDVQVRMRGRIFDSSAYPYDLRD